MGQASRASFLLSAALTVAVTACGGGATSGSTSATSTSAAPPATLPATSSPTTSVLARVEYPGGATYVTGHIADFSLDEGTITTDASGMQHSRDGKVQYHLVSADPRVDGAVTGTWNTDRWGTSIMNGAFTQWGSATLTNDGGTWEGPYTGGFASAVGDVMTRWWRGAGGYEGLTFYMWIAGSTPGVGEWDWGGIIVPGDPPPGASS